MKLLNFFNLTDGCHPIQCALQRSYKSAPPCYLKHYHPEEYAFVLEHKLMSLRILSRKHRSIRDGRMDACLLFTDSGRAVYKQLKGDFS